MLTIIPILLFAAVAAAMSITLLMPAKLLAPRRTSAVKRMPYESGMDPIHDTRRRFDVRFHLVAIAFLVFDVELLFLYPWAVASRPLDPRPDSPASVAADARGGPASAQLTAPSYEAPKLAGINRAIYQTKTVQSRGLVFGEAITFIGLLGLGFAYAWRKGVFRWG